MAKARAIPDLSADEPMAVGAARILEVRTGELREHAEDVLDTDDIERVHDMRVATRRLRAALEVFEACFPKKPHRTALAEVKELADALGARRDRDVAIESLKNFGGKLPTPDRRGVESLVETLRMEQVDANQALRPYVAHARVESLCERLHELAAAARAAVRHETGREPPRESGGNGAGPLA